MKKSKKTLGIVFLCVMATICICITAFAAETDTKQDEAMGYTVYNNYKVVDSGAINGIVAGEVAVAPETTAEETHDISNYTVYETTLLPIDDNTYQVVTPDGEVIAIYSTVPSFISRAYRPFSFSSVKGGQMVGTDEAVESYEKFIMSFEINYSRTGETNVGILVHDEEAFYTVYVKDDSFTGSISFTKSLGSVSFGVYNATKYTISYSGKLDYGTLV